MGNAGESHGVWSVVKDAIGGLFGPNLSDERRMEVEVTFGLIGFIAKSDGLITSYEADFNNHMLDEFHLNNDARAIAMAAHQAGCKTAEFDVEANATRFLETFPAGSEGFERLFESLLKLALSDDRVYPRERMALVRIATAFGVSEKQLDQRMAVLKR